MVRAVSLAGCFQPEAPLSLAAEKQLLLRHCLFDGNKYKPFDRVCQRVVFTGEGQNQPREAKRDILSDVSFCWRGRRDLNPRAAFDGLLP